MEIKERVNEWLFDYADEISEAITKIINALDFAAMFFVGLFLSGMLSEYVCKVLELQEDSPVFIVFFMVFLKIALIAKRKFDEGATYES